jgi:probable rRNA maturation factor
MFNCSLRKMVRSAHQPNKALLIKWLKRALLGSYANVYVDVIIVGLKLSQELNLQYRQKDAPTNVISLEYSETRDDFKILTGELILCDSVIVTEALEQNKAILAHYAHMIIHGMLHLQGYDHQNDKDAAQMEAHEISILQSLGYPNPYSLQQIG